jgi:hypothetical protein
MRESQRIAAERHDFAAHAHEAREQDIRPEGSPQRDWLRAEEEPRCRH